MTRPGWLDHATQAPVRWTAQQRPRPTATVIREHLARFPAGLLAMLLPGAITPRRSPLSCNMAMDLAAWAAYQGGEILPSQAPGLKSLDRTGLQGKLGTGGLAPDARRHLRHPANGESPMQLHLSISWPTAVRWAAPFAVLLLSGSAPAEEFYYVAMFASQTKPNNPDYAHTFAAFLKASDDGPAPNAYVVEDCFCISWLPQNLNVRTCALLPESGGNFGLHKTLDNALSNNERVSMWGPYRIEKELYDRAIHQVALLNSGQVRYKAVDSGYPNDRVSNCIHAVAACADGYRVRILSPGFGQTASWVVLQRFQPWIIDAGETHEWVYSYLGLEAYPIKRLEFNQNPRGGAIWTAIKP